MEYITDMTTDDNSIKALATERFKDKDHTTSTVLYYHNEDINKYFAIIFTNYKDGYIVGHQTLNYPDMEQVKQHVKNIYGIYIKKG